jgi:predicted peptidase
MFRTMLTISLAALVLITLTTKLGLAADSSPSQKSPAKGDPKDFEPRQHKDSDGNVLPYRLFKPKNFDATKKYPLILFLHGAGERGADNTAQVRDALHFARPDIQDEHPCFIVAPQCPAVRPMIQVYGIAKPADPSYNDYAKAAPDWKSYSIPLWKLPTGEKSWLTLINASGQRPARNTGAAGGGDEPKPPVSVFRNIAILEGGANSAAARPLDLRKLSFDKRQGRGELKVSQDGSTVTLTGDLRVKAPFPFKVSPYSVLTFDFRSPAQGAVHAIALDTDEFFDFRWANMDWAAAKGSMGKEPSIPMKLTMEVLDQLRKELPVDEKRIYVTGLSMGGYGTWDLIARRPDFFAGAVPVCGGADDSTAPAIKHIPIWCFHGGADPTVKPERSRNMIAALKAAGGNPKYTEYPGVGHNSWDRAYSEPELAKWLFAQRLRE